MTASSRNVKIWLCYMMLMHAVHGQWYLDANGCSRDCQVCNRTLGVCDVCKPGFVWDITTHKCIDNSNKIQGCEYYLTASICQNCVAGYMTDKGSCQQCKVENCKYCNDTVNNCKTCNDGFVKPNTLATGCTLTCKASNCVACDPTNLGVCLQCKDNYRLNGGVCEKCTLSGCKSCTASASTCFVQTLPSATCVDHMYYVYANASCLACADACLTCSAAGNCLQCNTTSGRTMNADGICVNNVAMMFWIEAVVVIVSAFVVF